MDIICICGGKMEVISSGVIKNFLGYFKVDKLQCEKCKLSEILVLSDTVGHDIEND